jgi:hypothetical protein
VTRARARRRKPDRAAAGPTEIRLDVTGELDDYGAAALQLEVDELARRLGATITLIQDERAEDERSQ